MWELLAGSWVGLVQVEEPEKEEEGKYWGEVGAGSARALFTHQNPTWN